MACGGTAFALALATDINSVVSLHVVLAKELPYVPRTNSHDL
jgi:hypothetical protein